MQGAILGGDGAEIALADLPPFLRLLLTTDGTVTKSLEAFYWEPVKITQVEQHLRAKADTADNADGARSSGADVSAVGAHGQTPQELIRRVKLVGALSERPYARALSCVQIELLPAHLAQNLLAGEIGIGELVRTSGLDTFRQILDLGLCQSGGGAEIWRQYAIYFNHLPLIDITEWFSLAVYQ